MKTVSSTSSLLASLTRVNLTGRTLDLWFVGDSVRLSYFIAEGKDHTRIEFDHRRLTATGRVATSCAASSTRTWLEGAP